MKKSVLFIFILLSCFSISAASLSIQQKLGFSDNTVTSKTSGTILSTFNKEDEIHTIGFKAEDSSASILYNAELQVFSNDTQQWQLRNSEPVLMNSNSIFLNITGNFKRQFKNSNQYTIAFLTGVEGRTKGNSYASLRFAGGVNMNATKIDGIKNPLYTFNPVFDLTFGFKIKNFLSSISLISNTPFYNPAEIAIGFSGSMVYMVNENIFFGIDGDIFFADLPTETKYIMSYETDLFFIWRFDV